MADADPFLVTLHQLIEISMRYSMRNFIRYVRESGLSMSQLGALFYLNRMGTSGVSDLADHLGVSNAASSQMIERLVQQNLILRTEDPNDRRVKQIILTQQGRQILEDGIRARQGWLEDLASCLSDQEKEEIVAALQLLLERTENLSVSSPATN